MNHSQLVETLTKVANEYPSELVAEQRFDIPRIAFNIELTTRLRDSMPHAQMSVCDLGGGLGMFSVGCAAMGFKRVVVVDDFQDEVNLRLGDSILRIHKKYGVEIVARDVVADGLGDAVQGTFDAITCFDSIEHWHHSPKKVLHEAMSRLRSGGRFIISAPNCFNLRKRIATPLGVGKWSLMSAWYEAPVFRGHVREPSVADLKYIARDVGLCDLEVYGRNWTGYQSYSSLLQGLIGILDYPLRLRPTLCSSIYACGRKP